MENTDDNLVYKGFKAWVVMDDKPLPQFGVEYKDLMREVTGWIPSEAGKSFSVCYHKIAQSDKQDFTARVYLDGQTVAYDIIHGRSRLGAHIISCFEVSETETRDFMFSPVELTGELPYFPFTADHLCSSQYTFEILTDDDTFLRNPLAAQLGEIKIVIRAVQRGRKISRSKGGYRRCREIEKIHERSKKGSVHQIKYSAIRTRSPCVDRQYQRCTPVDDPITFVFKYQPLEMLQAKGVAPRPTLPEQENNDEEDDEIVIRERELLAELEQVRNQKRARSDFELPIKRLKTEPVHQNLSGEVIDLTERLEEVQHSTSEEIIDLT